MKLITLSHIANRIEELESLRDTILEGDFQYNETNPVYINLWNDEEGQEDVFDINLTDCKKELVNAVVEIMNGKIEILKRQLVEMVYPKKVDQVR